MCACKQHQRYSAANEFRIGYNHGYRRKPPHMALINEPDYRAGYEYGDADRREYRPSIFAQN